MIVRLQAQLITECVAHGQRVGNDHVPAAACRGEGNVVGQAHALYGLASGYPRAGRFDEAYPYFLQAYDLFVKTGELVKRARIHSWLTWLAERRGDPADALQLPLRGLELYRAAGNRTGEAEALGDVGWCYALLVVVGGAVARRRVSRTARPTTSRPTCCAACRTFPTLGI